MSYLLFFTIVLLVALYGFVFGLGLYTGQNIYMMNIILYIPSLIAVGVALYLRRHNHA